MAGSSGTRGATALVGTGRLVGDALDTSWACQRMGVAPWRCASAPASAGRRSAPPALRSPLSAGARHTLCAPDYSTPPRRSSWTGSHARGHVPPACPAAAQGTAGDRLQDEAPGRQRLRSRLSTCRVHCRPCSRSRSTSHRAALPGTRTPRSLPVGLVQQVLRQGRCRTRVSYGSANATSASPSRVPSLPCPPAAITTNCLPSGRSRYVIGSAWPPAGNRPFHNSAPVSTSNARR